MKNYRWPEVIILYDILSDILIYVVKNLENKIQKFKQNQVMYQFLLAKTQKQLIAKAPWQSPTQKFISDPWRHLCLFKDKMNNAKQICTIQANPVELPTFSNTWEQCHVVFIL